MRFSRYFLILYLLCASCVNQPGVTNYSKKTPNTTFESKGFALVYSDNLYKEKIINKKLDNEKYLILHAFLKNRSNVKIYNPDNSKFLLAKVKHSKKIPTIFNSVITQKIANDLEIDLENPYVEISEIKKNKKFIAKKAVTYEEERSVAIKIQVDEISINEIGTTKKKLTKKENHFIINIADFYYMDSAQKIVDKFKKEGNISNLKIKKISDKKFKVLSGPFVSFNAMKKTYFSLNELGFENLEIIKIK